MLGLFYAQYIHITAHESVFLLLIVKVQNLYCSPASDYFNLLNASKSNHSQLLWLLQWTFYYQLWKRKRLFWLVSVELCLRASLINDWLTFIMFIQRFIWYYMWYRYISDIFAGLMRWIFFYFFYLLLNNLFQSASQGSSYVDLYPLKNCDWLANCAFIVLYP